MRTIREIAQEIRKDWHPVNYAARPYLDAMLQLERASDRYGMDDARSVLLYFLSNASSWRGETARRVKSELKSITKGNQK